MSHVTRKSSATRINIGHLSATCIENPRVTGSIPVQATILKRYILKTLFTVCTDRLPKFTTINSGIYGIDNWEWRDKSLDLRQI